MSNLKVSELKHYGIPGMKWGKRNGPPYPLNDRVARAMRNGVNAGVATASQQAAQTIVRKTTGQDKSKEKVSKIAKRILAGAAMTAATSMLGNLIQSISMDLINAGMEAAKEGVAELKEFGDLMDFMIVD